MTTGTQQTNAPRWVLPFLAALVAALAAILLGTTASASAAGVVENRVGAISHTVEPAVGPPQHVSAGQHSGRAEDSARIVVATGVAAKTESGLLDDVAETAAQGCSFSGATLVLMADGSKKPIEAIEVGDEVLATDPETGEQAAKRVEHVFVHDDALTDLQLADGTVLATTEDHPYWSVDDQRFERADQLSQGERVLGADGRTIEVSGLRLATTHEGLAYNLSVQGIHTYHVGVDEILVHNTCQWVPKKPGYTENKVVLPSAEAAEQAARDAAAVGGRCRLRGLCGSGNHYHVDYFNNDGLIFHTTLFRFPLG